MGGVSSISTDSQTLIIVNGKVFEDKDLISWNRNNIKMVSILKGATATALYGSQGIKGAINIETKACAENKM